MFDKDFEVHIKLGKYIQGKEWNVRSAAWKFSKKSNNEFDLVVAKEKKTSFHELEKDWLIQFKKTVSSG